jgi:hypothetical protein
VTSPVVDRQGVACELLLLRNALVQWLQRSQARLLAQLIE